MSTYVVGDIQGCYAELNDLLSLLNFSLENDRLWCVGDLINRGPENLAVMDLMMSLDAQVVLGNHDLHFLAVAVTNRTPSRADTFVDILQSPAKHRIVDWLRQQPLVYESEQHNCLLVHAGIPHIWSKQQTLSHAAEVQNILRSDEHIPFLEGMYGNEPAHWSEALSGQQRLRAITNYLTRMRFCSRDGSLNLTHKSTEAPVGYLPWFSFPRADAVTILFGHWAAIEGITHQPHCIALDTGCVWGRSLTAYCLEGKQFFSVPARNRQ